MIDVLAMPRQHRPVLVPKALRSGDSVRVVAPCSPFDVALVRRGMAWLSSRYRVSFDPSMFGHKRLLAGSDERRLRELNQAISDPEVRAIVAARGGYGLTRITPFLDYDALRRDPKWIVGFSDVTALHAEAVTAGVCSLHGHNVAGLGRGDALRRLEWQESLEHPHDPPPLVGLEAWTSGRAEGTMFGGNLTLLFTCAAAGRLRLPERTVLLLEDVAEPAYRLDRMLSALRLSGAFDRVVGVVLGHFVDCPATRGVPHEEVLREGLSTLGVPVLAGLPVGHGRQNRPVFMGYDAVLDSSAGSLIVSAPEDG